MGHGVVDERNGIPAIAFGVCMNVPNAWEGNMRESNKEVFTCRHAECSPARGYRLDRIDIKANGDVWPDKLDFGSMDHVTHED